MSFNKFENRKYSRAELMFLAEKNGVPGYYSLSKQKLADVLGITLDIDERRAMNQVASTRTMGKRLMRTVINLETGGRGSIGASRLRERHLGYTP